MTFKEWNDRTFYLIKSSMSPFYDHVIFGASFLIITIMQEPCHTGLDT